MIQVDVFWSFAMGAQFAICAYSRLAKEPSAFQNSYFVYTVLFLSLIFGPSGAYLLWAFTGWETMFMLDRDMDPLLPTLFSVTNVSQGVLAFYIIYRLAQSSPIASPFIHLFYIVPYALMFGILGFGYDRFLYSGSIPQFNANLALPVLDFFSCPVFYTLLLMSIFVLPGIFYPVLFWSPTSGASRQYGKWNLIGILIGFWMVLIGLGSLIFIGYEKSLGDNVTDRFSHVYLSWTKNQGGGLGYGRYDPLVGFVVAQAVFGLVTLLPILVAPSSPPEKTKTSAGKKKKNK